MLALALAEKPALEAQRAVSNATSGKALILRSMDPERNDDPRKRNFFLAPVTGGDGGVLSPATSSACTSAIAA